MDGGDTTTIALAGIIATAVVGVLGPAVTAWFSLRAKRGDLRASREDELRAVIEQAAVRLTEAILRLDDARDHLTEAPNPAFEPLHGDAEQLWLNEDRLGIRLGTAAPECVHFNSAVTAWQRAYGALADLSGGASKSAAELRSIKDDRMAAFNSAQHYKDAAAARLSPDAKSRTRRAARKQLKHDTPEATTKG